MKSESNSLTIALIREVFSTEDTLVSSLKIARDQGAELAVLPELPLNDWSPATKTAREEDAERPRGWREIIQRNAAKRAGVAILGGVIRAMKDDR